MVWPAADAILLDIAKAPRICLVHEKQNRQSPRLKRLNRMPIQLQFPNYQGSFIGGLLASSL
jgi:hypothetical protein